MSRAHILPAVQEVTPHFRRQPFGFAALSRETLSGWCADNVPFQHAMSTKSGCECIAHAIQGLTELNPRATKFFFFFFFFFSPPTRQDQQQSDKSQVSQDKSAKSGMAPSTPKKFPCCDTSEHANARPHEVAIIRDHRLRQAKNMLLLRTGGASLALAAARSLMNVTASSLHLPPVSKATTTRRHLSPSTSSVYFASLSARALVQTAPFTASSSHFCHECCTGLQEGELLRGAS